MVGQGPTARRGGGAAGPIRPCPSPGFITSLNTAPITINRLVTCTFTCTAHMLIDLCDILYISVYEIKDYKSDNSDSIVIILVSVENMLNHFIYIVVILETEFSQHLSTKLILCGR